MSTPTMSCPSGGEFYACASGSNFVGCCLTNPCGTAGCAAGQLAPTSFDAAQYGNYSDQQCDAGLFYTCAANDPPFWGCCSSVPCGPAACPTGDFAGAFLSGNPDKAEPFLSLNDTWVATASPSASTTASTSSSAVSSSTATSAADSTTLPTAAPHNSSPNVGAIAGGVVGGLAVLCALILGLVFLLRRRKAHKPSPIPSQPHFADNNPNYANTNYNNGNYHNHDKVAGSPVPSQYYNKSPGMASGWSQPSPQPPYSPGPPMYTSEHEMQQMQQHQAPQELSGTQQWELDGESTAHPKPNQGLGIKR